jgi:N6-adenosine-specific RNA methylase IME4
MTDLRNLTAKDIAAIRPFMGFSVIYADPPWAFAANSEAKPGKGARRHYQTMKTPEIAALPVRALAAKDSLCLMWATAPMIEDALRVMRAWHFTYKSMLVWPKNKIATGYWARNAHEIVLIGRRGRFPCDAPALFPTSIIPGKVREHSRKPDWVAEIVQDRHPDLPKLELFARAPRPGWMVLGNQTDKFEVVT